MVAQRIYLIRHGESQSQSGETEDNINPDLSAHGILQAKRLFPLLQDCHPDLILLSPLQRAWKTFLHSQKTAAKQRFDSRLIETYQPEHYAGRAPFKTPDIADQDLEDAYSTISAYRLDALWKDIRSSNHRNIMCFSHWNTCGHFLRAALGIGANNYISYSRMDNAALSIIDIDDRGTSCLRVWNHTEHLNGLLPADESLNFLRQ
ncbi:MAG: histidine phosphatase family protein [Planctomycetes bacterium]|nr:histidine phosphatase family protein [Planctomycetota bacterium]